MFDHSTALRLLFSSDLDEWFTAHFDIQKHPKLYLGQLHQTTPNHTKAYLLLSTYGIVMCSYMSKKKCFPNHHSYMKC